MGGGDVKLIAVVGAIDPFHFGLQWSVWSIFCSIMAAGAMALVIVTMQGKLISSFRNVFRSLFTAVLPGMEHQQLKVEDSAKMPFGYGIAVGTLCCVLFFLYGYLPY
jgi:Flp pilus assembly protein protease CpaA